MILKGGDEINVGDIVIVRGVNGKPDTPHQVADITHGDGHITIVWDDQVESRIDHDQRIDIEEPA